MKMSIQMTGFLFGPRADSAGDVQCLGRRTVGVYARSTESRRALSQIQRQAFVWVEAADSCCAARLGQPVL